MNTYEVTVVVDGFDMESEFQNANIECLSYDTVASRTGSVTRIDADIDAPTAVDAVMQLIADLRSINVTVVRIDPVLVSVPEIADRADISRETARLWATGKRRTGFPRQYTVVGVTGLWFWADVHAWMTSEGIHVETPTPVPSNVVEALNGAMAEVRSAREEGWMLPTSAPVAHIAQRQIRHAKGWRTVQVASA